MYNNPTLVLLLAQYVKATDAQKLIIADEMHRRLSKMVYGGNYHSLPIHDSGEPGPGYTNQD